MIKKAFLYKTSGEVEEVAPKGKKFSYEELRAFVGGMVEIVAFPDGRAVVCNEEGKLIGLPENEKATALWKEQYPISKYPFNNDELMVGNVLVSHPTLID